MQLASLGSRIVCLEDAYWVRAPAAGQGTLGLLQLASPSLQSAWAASVLHLLSAAAASNLSSALRPGLAGYRLLLAGLRHIHQFQLGKFHFHLQIY